MVTGELLFEFLRHRGHNPSYMGGTMSTIICGPTYIIPDSADRKANTRILVRDSQLLHDPGGGVYPKWSTSNDCYLPHADPDYFDKLNTILSRLSNVH